MPVDAELFKKVLGSFCTGVTIVTFHSGGIHYGLTVNAFSSVSLDPPLILVCIKKDGVSHDLMSNTGHFVVNLLSFGQQDMAWKFADPNLDSDERYKETVFELTEKRIPVFENNLAHLECKIVENLEGGDHTIFLGEVELASVSEGREPLLYFRGQFLKLP